MDSISGGSLLKYFIWVYFLIRVKYFIFCLIPNCLFGVWRRSVLTCGLKYSPPLYTKTVVD